MNSIKLISAEGFDFVIPDKEVAFLSNVIKAMMQGIYFESNTQEVRFHNISTPVLEKVCQYLYHKHRWHTIQPKSRPEFKVSPEISLEFVMATDFLDV